MNNDWTQVDIYTTPAGAEPLGAALMDAGFPSFAIKDPADFESFLAGNSGRWDYIDDELMSLRGGEAVLTVYLPGNRQGRDGLFAIRDALSRLKLLDADDEWGRLEYSITGVREEDWAFAWKKYYKPVKVGEKLVVCPSWEEYTPKPGEAVIKLDPGMAFGTGTHETTRLCLTMLETLVKGGERVLDIGCGSGILSVAAVILGAKSADGIDIDETAVRVAQENAELNGVSDKTAFAAGDLAEKASGKYRIVCANIVADAVMRLADTVSRYIEDGGFYLVSGIIDDRAEEVLEHILGKGMKLVTRIDENGWTAMTFRPEAGINPWQRL